MLAAALPSVMVAFVVAELEGLAARTAAVAAGAAIILPNLFVVYDVASGRRPRLHPAWIVPMTAILLAFVAAQGWQWSNVGAAVITTALLLVPLRVSIPACLAGVVVLALVSTTVAPPAADPLLWAAYVVSAVVWRTSIVFTLTWLVAAASHLQAARVALADQVVLRQRAVAEEELRATVGQALLETVERGRLVASGTVGAERVDGELAAMAAGARTALAGARDLVSRYRRSAEADGRVEAVVALLEAAGWDVSVVTATDVGVVGDEALEAAMSRVLGEAPGVVEVVVGDGGLALRVSDEGFA